MTQSDSPKPPPPILWEPSQEWLQTSNLTAYLEWLKTHRQLEFADYNQLWEWSTENLGAFWESIWDYFQVVSDGKPISVVSADPMPKTRWFEGARVNYAENIFARANPDHPAIIYKSEGGPLQTMHWNELSSTTGRLQNFLLEAGVQAGDRVAAYLPNVPEATIAFLATCSSGAVWSSTSPDFGTSSVIDRFSQIEPKILIGVNGYYYGGKYFDRTEELNEIAAALPSVERVIVVESGRSEEVSYPTSFISWSKTLIDRDQNIDFKRVEFNDPIWILYSSGTTGLPKPITHSQGGVLLEHLKYLTFHNDVKPGERFFWFTTTGWMMWNYLHASLLCGATIVLYDGSPAFPDMSALWRFSEEAGINHFGTSAGFIVACIKAGISPGREQDLSALRSIGSTGSPLPPEGFDWIYREVKKDLWLASISGGTDVCSAFVGGNPLTPVYRGEIQCRALGCKLEAFDENGKAMVDEVGEMVITQPLPSMPIYFWGDDHFSRYQESYFEMYPGIWRHGDWTSITPRGGIVIYGRSDSTLNRGGVRIGTSEIYRCLDKMEEIADSLIICLERNQGEFYMPLFIVPNPGYTLDSDLISRIKSEIRESTSPRHVPDDILEIREVPYTISGKKVETPIKKILMGRPADEAINPDALKNPDSLDQFFAFRQKG